MGSVTYRRVGSRWHIRFRERGDEKVKTYDGSLPEYAIKRKTRWFKQEWDQGYYNPFEDQDKDPRLTKAIKKYCASKRRKGDWNEKTAEISQERLTLAANFIGPQKTLSTFRSADFQEWINNLPGSPYTRQSYRSTLNTFLKWCFDKKYTSRQLRVLLPSDDYKQIHSVDSSEYTNIDQLQTITSHFHNQHTRDSKSNPLDPELITDLWWLLFWQLLYKEELCSLHASDILDEQTRIRLSLTEQKTKILPLVPPAQKIVKRYLQTESDPALPLFDLENIQPIADAYQSAVRQCFDRKNADLRELRRGGIIHYLHLGKPLQSVSRLARHQDIITTVRKYAGHIPEQTHEVFDDIRSPGSN